jgi:coatomer subunit beta'
LANLYNGSVHIWNYVDQTLVKSFEVTDLPVRTSKFIARKQWIAAGSDDMMVRIFNYNTMDKVKVFEAHSDYIRSMAVHPTQPYLLTSSDDMLIKLWDWEQGWNCTQIFEGHTHYVMQVVFNPKDSNTFASASLDHTVKVWSTGQQIPNFTLEGHDKGINCLEYFTGGDKPHLITGGDDKKVKIWDYQTKSCVNTLEGHTHNISAVCFHPELPLIVTGSEDGTIRLWHSTTYRLEQTLNYGLERVWTIAYLKGSNMLAIGYDEGTVLIKIGREEPLASMDAGGKIILAKHNDIQTVNLKSLPADTELNDGERISLATKDLGSSDVYPQSLKHSPNGRFVSVCGDGEYVIYTALAWRNKSFGQGLEFVWSYDSSMYAIKESASVLKTFKNFKEDKVIRLGYHAEGIFGGALLGVRTKDFICFYDWLDGTVIRRIDVAVKNAVWNERGDSLALVTDDTLYVLQFDRDIVDQYLESGQEIGEDGIEDAFEVLHEISARVQTATWVGDCLIYTNAAWHLNYVVGGEVTTLFHLDHPMYLVGYLRTLNRLILVDKDFSVLSYKFLLSIIEYKTLVIRGDLEEAAKALESIPKESHNSMAEFLEAKGYVEEALAIATDDNYKFDLSVQLGKLDYAMAIAQTLDTPHRWKQLGELALSNGDVQVAEDCYMKGKDLSGLLLIYTAKADADGMEKLVPMAKEEGKMNIAFLVLFLLGRTAECLTLLCESSRYPEAALLARTYVPSKISEIVTLWKKDLSTKSKTAAESLADPESYNNLFPDLEWALKAETLRNQMNSKAIPSSAFAEYEGCTMADLIAQVKDMSVSDNGHPIGNGVQVEGTMMDAPPVSDSPVEDPVEEEEAEPEMLQEPEPEPAFEPEPEPEAEPAFEPEPQVEAEEASVPEPEEEEEAEINDEDLDMNDEENLDVELDDDWGLDAEDEEEGV